MIQEYMSKAIETESGVEASCWIVTEINLNLSSNSGYIRLWGYKDVASKIAGKASLGSKLIQIDNIAGISCYTDVRNTILSIIPQSELFSGATLGQEEYTIEEPIIQEV